MSWDDATVSRLGEMVTETLELGEMTVAAGDAAHDPAGHLADVPADSVLIEITRSSDYRRKAEHLSR